MESSLLDLQIYLFGFHLTFQNQLLEMARALPWTVESLLQFGRRAIPCPTADCTLCRHLYKRSYTWFNTEPLLVNSETMKEGSSGVFSLARSALVLRLHTKDNSGDNANVCCLLYTILQCWSCSNRVLLHV